jgi:acyl-CoA thioester hydrolase
LQNKNEFSLLVRVRYGECDVQQVVFNARYADYVDLALTEYMRHKIGGFQTLLAQGLDNQVVNLNMDFRSSARFDDVLEIEVEVLEAQITYVMVDSTHFQKTPLSPWFKEQLSVSSAPVIINQAAIDLY